jgi:CHAT domain-containing protein
MVEGPQQVDSLGDGRDSLLAVGGVDFSKRAELMGTVPAPPAVPVGGHAAADGDALRGGFETYWGRLPATAYEAQVVSDIHQDALGEDASRLLLQGADATEERLKAEMPRHAILHIATHGYFQPEGLPSMWEQALDAVSGERGLRMTDTAARLTGLHPGLLSGLVLAGANQPPEEDASDTEAPVRDDGYLTASDVTLLDLGEVELVVLSACETGLGRPQSGEGLLGLRRAFHMAGADTVISSLWSVKDESTSQLMQAFYRNLFFEGMGRHEALRAAQLEMLARNRAEHGTGLPSTWGAFVLSGEWR